MEKARLSLVGSRQPCAEHQTALIGGTMTAAKYDDILQ